MQRHTSIWAAYTDQVLAWELGASDGAPQHMPLRENSDAAQQAAQRLLRLHAASGRAHCLLLGAGDGTLARLMAQNLPPHNTLLLLESHAAAAREALPVLSALPGVSLLADTSPWALLMLTCGAGLSPENCTVAWTLPRTAARRSAPAQDAALQEKKRDAAPQADSPPTAPPARWRCLDTWRRLFTGAQREALPPAGPLRISVGCILHPDEPHLPDFFAHIPPWVHEVAVVWDGAAPRRASSLPCPVPVRAMARPLNGDFAAQRNAMLSLCTGDWCLYLDADERLEPSAWAALPRLAACAGAGGVLFPRVTFEGDTRHARMGYGLWPDVQLRFFPLHGSARFQGAVHERLLGLRGDMLLAADLPLLHYSHVRKDRAALTARLEVFNRAAGSPLHTLSREYPALPLETLLEAAQAFHGHVLRLPLPPEPRAATLGGD